MAPTTLPGMKTTSSQNGRDVETMGFPIKMSEMLATLPGASYIVRRSVHDPGHINQTKKAIKAAFQVQINEMGFSLVEILSACPVNWNLEPRQALKFIKEAMIPAYPLGDFKVRDGAGAGASKQ